MSHRKHALAASRYCLVVAAVLFVVASVLPAQYLTEAFNVPMQPPGGGAGYCTIAADFNQNGYADLIYGPWNSQFFLVDLDPAVIGVGPYAQQAFVVGGGVSASRGAAADVNGDGLLDLVFDASGFMCINIGNGNGTFIPASPSSLVGFPIYNSQWLAMADVNNDGPLDLLVFSSFGALLPTLACYLNQFPSWPQVWQAQVQPWGMSGVDMSGGGPRLGDFDGDGNTDLAIQITPTPGYGTQLSTNVLWGNGAGQFTAPSAVSISGVPATPGLRIVGAADMNGDGITDLISSLPTIVGGAAAELLQVYLGNTTRSMTPAGTFTTPPTGGLPVDTFTADFNCDGWVDLLRAPASNTTSQVAGCNFDVTMVMGLPGGQFHQSCMNTTHTQPLVPPFCPRSIVADFDGDSDLDLMCTPNYGPLYYFRNRVLTGIGCSGSGAAAPGLWSSYAFVGSLGCFTSIYGALGNTPAVLAISLGSSTSSPSTCGVYLDLAGPVVFLSGITDSWGSFTYPLPLPSNPLLHGVPFYAQAAVLDPLGPNLGGINLALTPARTVIVW